MNTAPDTHPVRRNPPHVVVVFCGASGSGKTTIRDAVELLLFRRRVLYPVKESFARPLKREVWKSGVPNASPEFRDACQLLGDTNRAANVNIYVDALRRRVESHPEPTIFLVDDGRFQNEGQIADLVFRLTTKRENLLTKEQRAHPSENQWRDMWATETFANDTLIDIPHIATTIEQRILAFIDASDAERPTEAA